MPSVPLSVPVPAATLPPTMLRESTRWPASPTTDHVSDDKLKTIIRQPRWVGDPKETLLDKPASRAQRLMSKRQASPTTTRATP